MADELVPTSPSGMAGGDHKTEINMGGGSGAQSGQMSAGQMMIWVVVAIVVLAVFAAWLHGNARLGDVHTNVLLGHRDTGYALKQLSDMQYDGRQNLQRQYDWRLDELRFGQPYGNHTQPVGRRFLGGPQIVGSNLSTSTAVDGSVGNLAAEGF